MAGDLKGLTVTIGGNTTELGKALDAIKNKTSGAAKELKQINGLLRMDPGNTDLLAQKQTVLASRIAATKEKLEVLKQAQEQAAQAFAAKKISESDYRQIERDVIAAEQELRKLEQDAKKTGTALYSSGKKGAEGAKKTADAERDVGNEAKIAEGKVSSFGDVLKGTLAAQAIINGVRAIARGIKNIFSAVTESAQGLGVLSDDAEKVAMSAETLQSWQYAAKMVGFENEQLVKTMEKQQKAFSNAKTGSQALIDSYAAIGVDINKINSSEDAFEATINALAECHDETLRNAVANDIFGKSYADLAPLLNMGADGISKMRQEAYDLGLVISNDAVVAGDELADTFDTIGMQVDTAKAKLVAGMVPALQAYSAELEKNLSSEKTQKQLEKTGKVIGDLTAKALGLASKALPVLGDGLMFVTKNGKDLALAAGAAAVALNGFLIASKAKKLVSGLTASVKGLNAAIAANPIGAALTAISALIAILAIFDLATNSTIEKQKEMADSYREAADAAMESANKRRQAAINDEAEFQHYRDLVDELDSIVDAEGRVKEGAEGRANFIVNELRTATGTEIDLVDGVVQKYNELSAAIGEVLTKKQAESYLSSNQGAYETAKSTISSTEKDDNGYYVAGSQAAVEQAAAGYFDIAAKYADLQSQLDAVIQQYEENTIDQMDFERQSAAIEGQIAELANGAGVGVDTIDKYIATQEQAYYDALMAYDQNIALISQYEGVQNSVWANDVEGIVSAMETATNARLSADQASLASLETQRDQAIAEYNDFVSWSQQEGTSVTSEQVAQKRDAAVSAALEAYKKMIADSDQYTQEELDTAKQNLENQLTELTDESQDEIAKMIQKTEADARKAGGSYVSGVVQGINARKSQAYHAGWDLADEVNSGFEANLDINSPSKKARRTAAQYPEGAVQGVDGGQPKMYKSGWQLAESLHKGFASKINTPDRAGAAKRMADNLRNVLDGNISAPVLDFGAWGGNLNRYQQTTISGIPTDLSGIYDRLERIRVSVERIDPCMMIDGQRMSGALIGYTDADLGRRAAAAERGRLA